ncbi:MAG: SPASM domain-containing protein, partial [Desulfobacteraceae bacterium]|nr:SPASM domain-containing protein [Desulfobacteraceae bacterium]
MFSYKFRSKNACGYPVVVDLEPSNVCNFSCPHCEITYQTDERKNLSPSQYNVIMNNFPYAWRVKLQGEGEPFLNNTLYDFIEATCSKGVWCEVQTNGSVLDIGRMKELERYKNFEMVVSFDAADKKTFEEIRPGSNFDKILNNIEDVSKKTTINIAAWMLIQDTNKNQVKDVIRLLAEKGVRSLGLQVVLFDFDRNVEIGKSKINGKWVRQDLSKSAYSSLKIYAKRCGINLNISDRLYDRTHICPWPWMGVFVDTSGNVVPCCRIGDAYVLSMGNLNDVGIEDIWNSAEYKKFRLQHKTNDLPAV